MWGDSPIFPSITSQPSSSSGGLTIKQLSAMLIAAGIYANPQSAPLTDEEIAQKAKKAADVLVNAL